MNEQRAVRRVLQGAHVGLAQPGPSFIALFCFSSCSFTVLFFSLCHSKPLLCSRPLTMFSSFLPSADGPHAHRQAGKRGRKWGVTNTLLLLSGTRPEETGEGGLQERRRRHGPKSFQFRHGSAWCYERGHHTRDLCQASAKFVNRSVSEQKASARQGRRLKQGKHAGVTGRPNLLLQFTNFWQSGALTGPCQH